VFGRSQAVNGVQSALLRVAYHDTQGYPAMRLAASCQSDKRKAPHGGSGGFSSLRSAGRREGNPAKLMRLNATVPQTLSGSLTSLRKGRKAAQHRALELHDTGPNQPAGDHRTDWV
jgi:hypothetical protein